MITVPVGLNEVIITTDCSSCEYKTVLLKEIPDSVNLIWGSQKRENGFRVGEQQRQVVEHVRNLLDEIETDLVKTPFNSSEVNSVKNDVRRSRDEISESNIATNLNESLLYAYYAEWLGWNALYKMQLFELKYCVQKSNTVIETYENDECFVPDYASYKDYESANQTYFSLNSRELKDEYDPLDKKELDDMKAEITFMYDQFNRVDDSLTKCENSQGIINGTFEFQKPYCEKRGMSSKIAYIVWIIVFVYIGILIEKGGKIWKK